jgi:hypothetical protein
MAEYAAFLLILVLGFACGYGTARAGGIKQPEAELPDIGKIRIEEGDTVILRYKGLLTREQRTALKQMMEGWFKDHARNIIVLEAGLEVEVVKPSKTGSFYDPYNKGEPAREALLNRLRSGTMTPTEIQEAIADGKISINDVLEDQCHVEPTEPWRRRDDNRAQRAPEEPWQ